MGDFVKTKFELGGVATVTLARPDAHNAFNAEVIAELHSVFQHLGKDGDVRAIRVTAEGKSFSAGADLNWMRDAAQWGAEENQADAERLAAMLQTFNTVPKPTLALVQGAAFGGGVGLVACADIALATDRAKFAFTEVRLGIVPATISPFVIHAIGARACRRYFLTGERFDAATAHRIGLLHAVYDSDSEMRRAGDALLDEILKGAPNAVAGAKKLIFDMAGRKVDPKIGRETAKRIATHRVSEEGQEGLAAFFGRRPASWVPNK